MIKSSVLTHSLGSGPKGFDDLCFPTTWVDDPVICSSDKSEQQPQIISISGVGAYFIDACPLEKMIPIFLIVAGVVAALHILMRCGKKRMAGNKITRVTKVTKVTKVRFLLQ